VAVVVLQLPHGGEAEPRARLESLATSAVACVSRNSSERFLEKHVAFFDTVTCQKCGLICRRNASGRRRARIRIREAASSPRERSSSSGRILP
jgi:hypothetical protein